MRTNPRQLGQGYSNCSDVYRCSLLPVSLALNGTRERSRESSVVEGREKLAEMEPLSLFSTQPSGLNMEQTTATNDALSRLPVDLLVDSLLPAFSTRDVIALSRTSRQWYNFVTEAGQDTEIFWMRRCINEFNFPVRASGRRTRWFQLYSRLAQSAAYVWGECLRVIVY
jgi:hypothetical protein